MPVDGTMTAGGTLTRQASGRVQSFGLGWAKARLLGELPRNKLSSAYPNSYLCPVSINAGKTRKTRWLASSVHLSMG